MTNFLNEFENKSNVIHFIDESITVCPKCQGSEFEQTRASMRGTGQQDKDGLYCVKCRILYLLK